MPGTTTRTLRTIPMQAMKVTKDTDTTLPEPRNGEMNGPNTPTRHPVVVITTIASQAKHNGSDQSCDCEHLVSVYCLFFFNVYVFTWRRTVWHRNQSSEHRSLINLKYIK